MRAVIKEELAAAATTKAPNPPVPMSAIKENAPPTPELAAQRHEAMQDIQTLLASGKWDAAERAELHQKMAMLDPEQAAQAMQELVHGLDNGTISPTPDVPL